MFSKTKDNEPQELFRKESLERLSSPEQLDQMTQLVGAKTWIPVAALGTLLGIGVLWSIFGRIPITVNGNGVLIYPRRLVQLQAPASNNGQLSTLTIQEGDYVRKGEVIGTLDQTELQTQLDQKQRQLVELQSQAADAGSLQTQRTEQEKRAIRQQRETIEQQIQDANELIPVLQFKGVEALDEQRESLEQRLKIAQDLIPVFEQRLRAREELRAQKAITADVALQARQELLSKRAEIGDLEAQLKQLDTQETEIRRAYLDNLSNISRLKAQLQELAGREKALDQQDFEASTNRENRIKELQRSIEQISLQLEQQTKILSPYTGRVLEIVVQPGQIINTGTRIASIVAEDPNNTLMAVTYFPISEGKKIEPGVNVQDLTIQVTPQNVKRERFGGIVGKVTEVSEFPVTQEDSINLLGHNELAKSLSAQGQAQVEVVAILEPDTSNFSGYKWSSSKGPEIQLTSGTTTTARVVVEERAPITFVLPILRSQSGIY